MPLGDDAQALLQAIGERAEIARRMELGSGEEVLRAIVEATVALFQAEASSIALYDSTRDRLVFHVAAGAQGQGVIGLEVPPDQGLVGYVYTTGQAIAIADVQSDPRFGRAFAQQTGYVPRSIVAVPLLDDRGTIGVLEVIDKRNEETFSLRDIELASVFARQAAVAIRASRVERDVAALLQTVLAALAARAQAGETPDPTIDELVAAAVGDVEREDPTRLWALVDAVARIRRADPAQVDLLVDLLGVLAARAERRSRPGRLPRSG
jgi:GAF domain-containing protein